MKPIELGAPVRARYEDARGADVWSFDGRAGQIDSVADHSRGGEFSPVVQLTSPNGTVGSGRGYATLRRLEGGLGCWSLKGAAGRRMTLERYRSRQTEESIP